jgi:hypothetical protein
MTEPTVTVRKSAVDASVAVIVAARAVAGDAPKRPQRLTVRVRASLIADLREALAKWDAA